MRLLTHWEVFFGGKQKLRDIGLELGPVGMPLANFITAVLIGNLLFVASLVALMVGQDR